MGMVGKCHICEGISGNIKYCKMCDHWFCGDCRIRWFWRGIEAVKEKIKGRHPGCCGPLEEM